MSNTIHRLAPQFQDYARATARGSSGGIKVTPGEVTRYLEPNAHLLAIDPKFRKLVAALPRQLSGKPGATDAAVAPIQTLLAENPPLMTFEAKLTEGPFYSPGFGIEPPPDQVPDHTVFGPHISMTVDFGEGSAKAEAESGFSGHPAVVKGPDGKRVPVDGVVTVRIHGESAGITQEVNVPKPVNVPVVGLYNNPGQHERTYALIIRDDRPGHHGQIGKTVVFTPGPMPV